MDEQLASLNPLVSARLCTHKSASLSSAFNVRYSPDGGVRLWGSKCETLATSMCRPVSRLEVDHQLVLGRRLHGQVGRFLALEDAVNVRGRSIVSGP
jgi:hypothetical protein